jgi:hypothetical protein
MKETVVRIVLLLMIAGNPINWLEPQTSATDFVVAPTLIIKKTYLPLAYNLWDGRPATGYFASSNEADAFYVLPDRISVKNYSMTISVGGCGTYKITHTTTETVLNKQFAFTGSFYASGTFSSATAANGSVGLNKYNISGCGEVTGGPWSWSATWKNANQPDIREVFPVTVGGSNLALPDGTTTVEKVEVTAQPGG